MAGITLAEPRQKAASSGELLHCNARIFNPSAVYVDLKVERSRTPRHVALPENHAKGAIQVTSGSLSMAVK